MGGFTAREVDEFMIIEIRDMPVGAKIKTIDCHITFDDDGAVASVKSVASTTVPASEAPAVTQSAQPAMPQVEARPEKVSSEMQDIEF